MLRLLSAGGIGPARVHRLEQSFGSAEAALSASVEALAAALRVPVALASRIAAEIRGEGGDRGLTAILSDAASLGARLVLRGDAGFPQLLAVAPDPPALLFVRGDLGGDPEPAVAIVGSRRASAYGRLQAARIAEELAARGVTIVSGGARGIDAEAHRGALRAGGRTIAVVASGLRHPYPPEHASLFDSIVEGGGAVITEQCPAVEPRPELFPRRNRIVAALSLAVVVVEAAERSGALLTGRIAIDDLSREVGCIPGPVDAATSAGCNAAIRDGWARLVRGAPDVLEMLAEARTIAVGAAERAACQRLPSTGPPYLHPNVGGSDACDADAIGRDATRQDSPVRGPVVAADRGPSPPRGRGPTFAALGADSRRIGSGRAGSRREPTHEPTHDPTHEPMHDSAPAASRRVPGSADEAAVLASVERLGLAGLDELESVMGFEIPRLAVATLGLERRGLIRRHATGAFEPSGGRDR